MTHCSGENSSADTDDLSLSGSALSVIAPQSKHAMPVTGTWAGSHLPGFFLVG